MAVFVFWVYQLQRVSSYLAYGLSDAMNMLESIKCVTNAYEGNLTVFFVDECAR